MLHLSVHVCVCVCVCVCVFVCVYELEVIRSHFTAIQTVLFLCKATAGHYIMEPTCTASKRKCFYKSVVQKLDPEVGLRVAAMRLPKSSNRESRLTMDASQREVILF